MANSGLIKDYLQYGTHASRPATPSTGTNVAPLYYETDTLNTFVWTGSAWTQINGGGGAATLAVATKTANYTVTSSDDIILADATSGGFTVTLPTAVGWTKRGTVLKIDSSANAVTVGTTSAQTINGQSTRLLKGQFSGITLISDNANWRTTEEALPLTTKGDLLVGLAANDLQRLAVGSDGQLLSAASGQATGLQWIAAPTSGAMTLLATLSGASATYDFTSIAGSYNAVRLVALLRGDSTAGYAILRANNDSGTNYATQFFDAEGTGAGAGGVYGQTGARIGDIAGSGSPANAFSALIVDIPLYANSATYKSILSQSQYQAGTSNTTQILFLGGSTWQSTAAITRLTLIPGAGNWAANSAAYLYGIT